MGRGWESSIGRFALGHLFASLHVVATVTTRAPVPLRPVFLVPLWFRFWCVLPTGSESQRTPCQWRGTVYRNSWRPGTGDVGLNPITGNTAIQLNKTSSSSFFLIEKFRKHLYWTILVNSSKC